MESVTKRKIPETLSAPEMNVVPDRYEIIMLQHVQLQTEQKPIECRKFLFAALAAPGQRIEKT